MPVEAAADVDLPNRPTLNEVAGYVVKPIDDRLTEAYYAEAAAQDACCRTTGYGADLAEALKRRVACNLARRNVPLGVQMNDTGGVAVGTYDPEVRRLERPYRRLVVG